MKEKINGVFKKIFHRRITHRNINTVFLIIFLAGAALAIALPLLSGSETAIPEGIILLLVFIATGFFLKLLFWRCPHCDGLLPWQVSKSKLLRCPNCGENIKW